MKKLTLTLPDESMERVLRLAVATNDDESGVVGKAIQLYEGCVAIIEKGGSVFGEQNGERKTLLECGAD